LTKHVVLVKYVGTDFAGFQYQPENGKTWSRLETVQGKLLKALSTALNTGSFKALRMRAASRTDAGVHAHGQVVEFRSARVFKDGTVESRKLLRSLNSLLPPGVRCVWVSDVPDSFHVIQNCARKQYNYYISFNPVYEDPFTFETRHRIKSEAGDGFVERMGRAAKAMEGLHDFTAFSNKTHDGIDREAVRHVEKCEVRLDSSSPGSGSIYVVCRGKVRTAPPRARGEDQRKNREADSCPRSFPSPPSPQGFLYRQVRHMVGAMLWHAQGKLDLTEIERALRDGKSFVDSGGRKWKPAPAKGLHLMWCEFQTLDNGLSIPLPHQL